MNPWVLVAGGLALVLFFRNRRPVVPPAATTVATGSNATGQNVTNAINAGAGLLGSVASIFGYKPQSTMDATGIAKAGTVVVQGINGLVQPAEGVEPYSPQGGNDTQSVIDYGADFGGDASYSYTGVDGVPTVDL
jgi:hypothetical protein